VGILDPSISEQIRELLAAGQSVAAAKLICSSRHTSHRSIRRLRIECGEQLTKYAKEASERGERETAASHIELANECITLSGDAQRLRETIRLALELHRMNQEEMRSRVMEAQRLAAAGRIDTAIECLDDLGDQDAVMRTRSDLERKKKTFERYLQSCRQCIKEGDFESATRWYRRARKLKPLDAALSEFQEIRSRVQDVEKSAHFKAELIRSRNQAFAVSTDIPDEDFVIYSRNTLSIGARTSRDGADIQIASKWLHRHHAVFMRHTRDGLVQHWLAAHPSHSGFTLVDGEDIRGRSPRLIEDGNLIELGTEAGRIAFRFNLPVAKSPGTAVLIHDGCASSGPTSGRASRLAAPLVGGKGCRRIVLLADRLFVGTDSKTNHVTLTGFPVDGFEYRWDQQLILDDRNAFIECVTLSGIEVEDAEHAMVNTRLSVVSLNRILNPREGLGGPSFYMTHLPVS